DVLAQAGGREEHLAVAPAEVLGRRHADLVEPLLDRPGRFVGREDALAGGDQLAGLRVHGSAHLVLLDPALPRRQDATHPTARVARPGVPRTRPKTRLSGGPDDADAPGMRIGGRSTLQMTWLATALAGLLGIATPAAAHLAAERADTPPATAQIASSGAGVPVALVHDQPYPPRPVARPDPPVHRRHPADATATRPVHAVQP